MVPPVPSGPAPRLRGALPVRIQGHRAPDRLRALVAALAAVGLLAGCAPPGTSPTAPPASTSAKADAVRKIVQDTMASAHLKAVLVRVTVAGREVLTDAVGES